MAETNDQLYQKFSQLQGEYGKYHGVVREMRRMYDLDFADEVIPAAARARGFKAVIPRTSRRIIDEAVDHILYHPKVRIPVRPTKDAQIVEQEIAEKKRQAISAWWRQVAQRSNPLGDGRKWLMLDGMIAIKQTLRLDLLPDKDAPDYQKQIDNLGEYEFLWDVELLDNEWVFADPSNHRNPRYVYVAYDITAEHAREKFQGSTGKWRDREPFSRVKYIEYWSAPTFKSNGEWEPGKFLRWVDTELVHDGENPYPYVPVAIEDSGYGLVREGVDIEDKFVGLITHSQHILIAQARQWSAMQAVTELTAFNPVEARNMSEERLKDLKVGPGEIWPLDGDVGTPGAETIEMRTWPNIPITVPQMISLTDRELNGATKLEVLGGIPQSGVDTASEADQNIRNASAKLSAPVAALERIAAKLTRWALMDIELVLEAPATIMGMDGGSPAAVRLTPDDIKGYYDVSVQLRTTDEESLDLTRARFWGEMYRVMPFLSAWTAMEAGGIADDPLAEMVRRAGEDVFLSEEFKQIRVASGAKSFGALAEMIAGMSANKGSEPMPTGGSDMGLVTQKLMTSPVEDRIATDAIIRRETDQGASEIRGPR